MSLQVINLGFFNDTNEWMLKKDIFVRICSQFFNPDIDIFVSRLNHQIDNYASWSYDPEASSMDAFTISWKELHPYLFPPFTIIPRILSKIKTDTVDKAIISAFMAFTVMVPFINLIDCIFPCQITRTQRFNQHAIDRITTPANQENRFCRSVVIRQSLIDKGISNETSAFIISSWRKGTTK
jgi:hypothetical protein